MLPQKRPRPPPKAANHADGWDQFRRPTRTERAAQVEQIHGQGPCGPSLQTTGTVVAKRPWDRNSCDGHLEDSIWATPSGMMHVRHKLDQTEC